MSDSEATSQTLCRRLYDLTRDIGEQNNLADKHPDVVNAMITWLKRDGLL